MKATCLILMMVLLTSVANAQTPVLTPSGWPMVKDLSVTVSSKTYQKIQQGTTWEDLNPIDLVALKNREQIERIHEYIDADHNPVTRYELVSHTNAHPKWYKAPSLIIQGPDGMQMQMDISGPGPDDRFILYDSEDSLAYQGNKLDAMENGVLGGYVFAFPSANQVADAATIVDSVSWSNNDQTVTFNFDSRNETWDAAAKTKESYGPQQTGDGYIRVIHYYTWDEAAQLDLLRAVVIEQDMILDGGICGKEITIEEYADYILDQEHQDEGATPRSSSMNNQLVDFTVYPNPLRSDLLNITIPSSMVGQEVVARVVNTFGQPLYSAYLSFPAERQAIRLNTEQYPDGLYFLQLEAGEVTSTKSFFITK